MTIFYLRGRFVGLPVADLAASSALFARVVARPAVQRAITAEELPVGLAA